MEMLFEDMKLTDALRWATDGWSGDASAVDADVASAAASLLERVYEEACRGLSEGDAREALMAIKYAVRDAMAPKFEDTP
jgi:hypothetical protein